MRDQRGPLEEVGGAVAVVPDRPGVAARAGAHPIQVVVAVDVIRAAWVGAFDLRPGRAVPVHDQRVDRPDFGGVVIADRPGVAARAGAYRFEVVVADRARAGAADLRPGRAVPVQDQRVDHVRIVVGAGAPDRPGVAARHGAHPRKAVQARTRAGAVDLRPGRAVPVQDQRAGPAAVAGAVVPDRPGVAARAGADPVEGVVADRAWAGALDLRPGRAVPVQDQRVPHPGGDVPVAPDRPGVAARAGAHPVELAEERA